MSVRAATAPPEAAAGLRVRYAVLGPIELREGERSLTVGGPRQLALLALLLIHANRALSSDELIDAAWGRRDADGGLKRLQVAISRLRRTLQLDRVPSEQVLRTTTRGYLLAVAPGELDAELFETRMQQGRRALGLGDAMRARDVLRESLGLWRGPALAEVSYEEFAQPEIRRLDELRLTAIEALMDAELQLGGHAELIVELDALAAAHCGRERLAAQLMLALYRCGRQRDALEAYGRTRVYLASELGLEPGPALKALHGKILAQSVALGAAPRPGASHPPRPRPRAQPPPLPRPLRAAAGQLPFTGRDRELAVLTDSWESLDVDGRRVAVISGEAGIGKTRVAAELAASVNAADSLVLYGRCDEGLAAPYQPFVEVLRRLLPEVDVDELRARLGGLAPELSRLLPELTGMGPPPAADAESARYALFEAVVAFFGLAAGRRPTLLVIDDAQWAAPATLLLLRHLARTERPLAMLLVVTFRSTELEPRTPLAALLDELHREGGTRRIALGGLDERAIDALLRASVGADLADRAPRLAARVRDQTAGNPFFVRELLAQLVESDALAGTRECPGSAVAAALDVPAGLQSVVCHRVARLSEPARQLMTIASVAAGAFEVWLLESVLPAEGLLDALDEAVAAGLLVDCGRGAFDFTHALVRQAVYDNLGTARRLRLHRRLGEALEARGCGRGHVEALAHHFAQLAAEGAADKAVGYAVAAGESAAARLAYEDAAGHFQRGIDVLVAAQEPDAARHIDLLLGLGEARWNTGESDMARAAFEQAATIADASGDVSAAVDAALGYSGPPFFEVGMAKRPSAERLLRRALAMLDTDDSPVRARLMGRLAAARAYGGAHDDHHALAHAAIAMARRVEDRHALAEVLATGYWATLGPGDPRPHLRMARELTRLADEAGNARLRSYGCQWVLGPLLAIGDVEGVLRQLGELEQLAATRRDRFARWPLDVIRAMLAYVRGELGHSESLAAEALRQWGDRPQFAPAAHVFAAQMLPLRREQGRLAEVVEGLASRVEHAPEIPAWRCALAHVYAELGAPDRAARELELLGDVARLPRDALWLLSVTRIATVTASLGDLDRCRQLYALLRPHANTCVVSLSVVCEGSTSRPLGLLATALGHYDDAAAHFDRALEMHAKIGSPLWTAHTQVAFARMLRLRDRPRDGERARALLATARTTADELGLHKLGACAAADAVS